MQSTNQSGAIATAGQGKKLVVLGHSITASLTAQNTGGNHYMFECITAPGLGIPVHLHQGEDVIVTILEGEFSVVIGDKRYHVLKGDVCFFPKQVPYSFQNIGTKAGTTLWTVTPGANFEDFFNALGALPAGEPDPAAVVKIFANHKMKIFVSENN